MPWLPLLLLCLASLACSSKKTEAERKGSAVDRESVVATPEPGRSTNSHPTPVRAEDTSAKGPIVQPTDAGLVDAALPAYQVERRLEPSAAGNPTHATVRLLRKIGEGDWELRPLLSESLGLFIRIVVDEGKRDLGDRYCGDRLARGQEQASYYFQEVLERLDVEGVEIRCANEPRPPRCFVGMADHDHPAFEMRFADTSTGLALVAILEFDWGMPEASEKAERRAVEAELARVTVTPCPASL